MGYAALILTVAASAFAFGAWIRFITPRSHVALDLADASMGDADMLGELLPRDERRAWNTLCLLLGILFLGFPHWLSIAQFWRETNPTALDFAIFGGTLVYWLLLLGVPALFYVRQRNASRETARSATR